MQKCKNIKNNNIEKLVSNIQETNNYFICQAQKQVNTALTIRNYIIGFILAEYELHGEDRAIYGKKLFGEIAQRLELQGLKHIRERHLYLCKNFYLAYPQILRTATAKLYLNDIPILRTVSAKFNPSENSREQLKSEAALGKLQTIASDTLIERLSFSHIIELLKADEPVKRAFYEIEAISNNWSVRELERAMNSMLYERTGLSKNKKTVIEKQVNM